MVCKVSRGSGRTTIYNHENTKKGKTRKKRGVTPPLSLTCEDDIPGPSKRTTFKRRVLWN
jgi:hypothetical protein